MVGIVTFFVGITTLSRKVKMDLPGIAALKRALWELDSRYTSDLLARRCPF